MTGGRDLFGQEAPATTAGKRSALGYERHEDDFYATPVWVTKALLSAPIALRGPIWEPAGGDGAIVRPLLAAGHDVQATDLRDRGAAEVRPGVDFLACAEMPAGCVSIVTNPPYGDLAHAFLKHALDLARAVGGQVVMLLDNQFDASRRAKALTEDHPAYHMKFTLRRRIRWIGGTKGRPQKHHAWYLWDWGRERGSPFPMWAGLA